jgi:hypothetical protein
MDVPAADLSRHIHTGMNIKRDSSEPAHLLHPPGQFLILRIVQITLPENQGARMQGSHFF